MKRVFIIFMLLLCSGCGKVSEIIEENSEKNLIFDNGVVFDCDIVREGNFVITDSSTMVYNNKVYEIILNDENKIFSNNSQCIETDYIIDGFMSVDSMGSTIYIIDGKIYEFYNSEMHEVNYSYYNSSIYYDIDIKMIYYVDESTKYVLKNDGNIYRYSFDTDYSTGSSKVVSIDVEYSAEDYGKILYFYYLSNSSGTDILLYSSNGLWSYEKIETEECAKYEDVDCEYELIRSKTFDQYKSDVIFFTKYFIVSKDLVVVEMDELNDLFFTMKRIA